MGILAADNEIQIFSLWIVISGIRFIMFFKKYFHN